MATSVWRGHLTFGLVSIPVRLFKAARPEKIRFHRLHKSPVAKPNAHPIRPALASRGTLRLEPPPAKVSAPSEAEQYIRIRQSAYVPSPAGDSGAEAKPVPRNELVKGYEYDKNRYVVLKDEDLKKITPQTATEMQILEFVKLDEIDPVYFETSYYMAPDEAGERAYALLFQAMRETGYVAVAEVALHRREHVMVLRPGPHGLLAHTMFYANEIRQDQEHRADTSQVSDKELKMAKLLVESLAAPFEAAKYKDKFREKLEAMIAAKLEGRGVAKVPEAQTPAEVVDILQALENSLKLVRKPAARTAEPAARPKARQRRAH
ncbi:MAG: Ku protein [Bryobacteraceae bacterium]